MNKFYACIIGTFALLATGLVGAAPQTEKSPRPLQLDDVPLPLDAIKPRSESQSDRLHAAALFASGRMLEKQSDMAGALRKYQRAYRYDPQAHEIGEAIIPLAFGLGRAREAVRYALIVVESNPTDPVMMRRLALYLSEQGDWNRALRLYEALIKSSQAKQTEAEKVLLRMETGRLYFLDQQYKKAAEAFSVVQAALEDPKKYGIKADFRKRLLGDAGLTYQLFGECFLESDRLDEASAMFLKAHENKPNRGLLGYNLARVAARKNQAVEGLDKLQDYFQEKLTSEGTSPYKLLSELMADLNQQDAVIAKLEQLRETDSENRLLGFYLAQQYAEKNQWAKAEAGFEKLIAGEPKRPPLEAYRGLLEVYQKLNKPEKLLDTLALAVTKAGTLDLFDAEAKSINENKRLLDRLIELGRKRRKDKDPPDRVGESLALAQLALKAKRFEDGNEFYEQALKEHPDRAAEFLLTWGLELFLADRYEEAAQLFQRGVDNKDLSAQHAAFYYYLAGALEMSDKTDEAIKAAQSAAQLRPKSAQFASRKAWVQYHAKRYDQAIKSYLQLLKQFDNEHESSDTRDVLREARLVLSNIYVHVDDLPQSEEWLEQVLDEFPENIGAQNDLGYLWVDQNKHLERGLQMIQRAVAAEPDNRAYLDSLGWAHYRLGQFKQAVVALEKATEGEEPDGVILDHLGDVYHKLGNREKAQAVWQRALKTLEKEKDIKHADQVRKKIK